MLHRGRTEVDDEVIRGAEGFGDALAVDADGDLRVLDPGVDDEIGELIDSSRQQLTICTPYFNLPLAVTREINRALARGVRIDIIVGDKTANDFYIPPSEPFKIIAALPYLYEISLRRFAKRARKAGKAMELARTARPHLEHALEVAAVAAEAARPHIERAAEKTKGKAKDAAKAVAVLGRPSTRLELDGRVVGWTAVTPVSTRQCYAGVGETSVPTQH